MNKKVYLLMLTSNNPHNEGSDQVTNRSFIDELKSRTKEGLLYISNSLLIIFRVTIIFIAAIIADYLIIRVITWSFGSIVNNNAFAATLLEGVQLLSALGTAVAYILYLIRALFKDIKETREVIQELKKGTIKSI